MNIDTIQLQLTTFLEQTWSDSPYRNNFIEGHRLALTATFPTCGLLFQQWHAAKTFNAILTSYIEHFPSTHWDINRYGEQLPDLLLAQESNPKAGHYPWALISDLATLEYSLTETYYQLQNSQQHLSFKTLHLLPDQDFIGLMRLVANQHPYANLNALLSASVTCPVIELSHQSTERNIPRVVVAPITKYIKGTDTTHNLSDNYRSATNSDTHAI